MDDQEFLRFTEEAKKHREKVMQEATEKGSYGSKLVAQAARQASSFAENDGLYPALDLERRDWRYKVQQGLRAACVGREDAAASLILMRTVLDNQQTIKRLLYVAVALLAYLAYKV